MEERAAQPDQGPIVPSIGQSIGGHSRVRPSDGAPTPDEIYRAFDKLRSVDRNEKTGLVTLGMKWHDPIVAAPWASEYATAANNYIRAQKISEAERSLKYLEEQSGRQASQKCTVLFINWWKVKQNNRCLPMFARNLHLG